MFTNVKEYNSETLVMPFQLMLLCDDIKQDDVQAIHSVLVIVAIDSLIATQHNLTISSCIILQNKNSLLNNNNNK